MKEVLIYLLRLSFDGQVLIQSLEVNMKDYLKEELSEEEKLILFSIIWRTARKYKRKCYIEKAENYEFIDNIDYLVEDEYLSYNIKYQISPLNILEDEQKCKIVIQLDSLFKELSLFELIKILTFDEKLVFFLFYLEDFNNREVSKILQTTERTIFNKRKSIEKKINKMKGKLDHGRFF